MALLVIEPRQQYDEGEWRTLLFSALWVFDAVAGADEKIDSKEETAFLETLSAFNPTPLVDKIQSDLHANIDRLKKEFEADPRDVSKGLTEVEALLARYPNREHAAETRRALVSLATKVAEASGGFLGMGNKVSKAEADAIVRIRALLRLPA